MSIKVSNEPVPKTRMRKELEAYTSRILASQQAAHDAEIAKLNGEARTSCKNLFDESNRINSELHSQLSAANAACAMKDEALRSHSNARKLSTNCAGDTDALNACAQAWQESDELVEAAISASTQQVSEWERKQLEPLRAQVAALRGSLVGLLNSPIDIGCAKMARETLDNIQATAEQFIAECEQRGAVKALEEVYAWINSSVFADLFESYRTCVLKEEDGNSLTLADIVSMPDAISICAAQEEIEMIVDYVGGEINDMLRKRIQSISATSKKAG